MLMLYRRRIQTRNVTWFYKDHTISKRASDSKFLSVFIYFWERECVWERKRERERKRESRGGGEGDTESEAGSRFWAVSTEPNTGLKPTNREITTWTGQTLNRLSHPGAPRTRFLMKRFFFFFGQHKALSHRQRSYFIIVEKPATICNRSRPGLRTQVWNRVLSVRLAEQHMSTVLERQKDSCTMWLSTCDNVYHLTSYMSDAYHLIETLNTLKK